MQQDCIQLKGVLIFYIMLILQLISKKKNKKEIKLNYNKKIIIIIKS